MALAPYFKRQKAQPIGQAGRKSEKRLAKQTGARLRPNSGAVQGAKGDMVLGETLIESKSTTGRSFSVQHEHLNKIAVEAREQSKTPALTVSFVNADGRPCPNGDWVLIPLRVFKEMQS